MLGMTVCDLPSEAAEQGKSTGEHGRRVSMRKPRKERNVSRAWLQGLLLAASAAWASAGLAQKAAVTAAMQSGPRPEVSMPVDGLGYTPPGDLPEFYYYALVSLHYIDNTHLLFTFNTKGLLRRDDACPGADVQRRVRATVLDLPSGKVEKQADWQLYDFSDYLWGIGNGQFLLRRCQHFDLVDATLQLHRLINTGGAIEGIGLSPDRDMVVVQEEGKLAAKGAAAPQMLSSQLGQPPPSVVNVDFISLHPLALVSRAQIPVAGTIPIVSSGILEALDGTNGKWLLDIQPYGGQVGTQRQITMLHSACAPSITAVSNDVFVAMACPKSDSMEYEGYNLEGGRMWQIPLSPDRWMPRFLLSRDGSHFAIESIRLKHPHIALDPLKKDDVYGQDIDIYDTHNGILVGSFETTPVFTAGKNADFSPDGLHLAILHNGAIEIYSLNELARTRQSIPR